jgi:hypothetical protein
MSANYVKNKTYDRRHIDLLAWQPYSIGTTTYQRIGKGESKRESRKKNEKGGKGGKRRKRNK